jgi:hypothetical protein
MAESFIATLKTELLVQEAMFPRSRGGEECQLLLEPRRILQPT